MANLLELTLISASISSDVQLEPEPKEIYATVRCAKEQRRTKTAHDQGRLPVWNESFSFSLEDQDWPKFIFVQVFAVQSEQDEEFGVARIPTPTKSGETEGSLHMLISPNKGQTGHLKVVCRWKPDPQAVARDGGGPVLHSPRERAPYEDLAGEMEKMALFRESPSSHHGASPYPPGSGSVPPTSPYSSYSDEYLGEMKSRPYPPPPDSYPPITDAYPPYPNYQVPTSSSSESQISSKSDGDLSQTTSRGLGDTHDKGHHSHMPYGYPPPPMYGGGYPPPPPHGYSPSYDHGYPPAPPYPQVPHGYPPPPYSYPPAVSPYPSQPYPPHGYPPPAYGTHAPYPAHLGGYFPGTYVSHSSSWKPPKYHKHHKMPKHFKHHYGHLQPPMGHGHHHHYKHKKHKGFGKGHKFKKFKGFEGFKRFKF